jgi:4-amino-4-deoxy-L-arabinose transferase-like glycosyltransferase
MMARGDWIRPTFNGEPRYHKPVLIYWLMRSGYALCGDNPFGARLVSAVAGTATCLVVLTMGRRLMGDRAGFLAALMLTTAPIMVVESKLATTDATLALFLVSAQFALWELSRRDSRAWAAAFWVLLALAMLTKGPVGPVLIACAGLMSWWWRGPTSMWSRLRWKRGILLFLLVAAPWYIAIGLVTQGDFFRFALGKQIAERMTTNMEQHGGFPGYYVFSSLLTFHPWSALLPAAIVAAWTRRRVDPRLGFLLGWIIGPLILLECVKTKLVHYYLPAYPAAALLAAWLVTEVVAEGVNLRRWPLGRLGLGLLGGVGIGTATAFVALAVVLPSALRWPCLATATMVAAGTLWGLFRLQRAATERAVLGLAVTSSLAMLCLGGWLLPAAEPYRLTRVVGEKLARITKEMNVEPILLSFQEPTVVYAMGRSATLVRTWETFYERLDRHGELLTALIPMEEAEFARRNDHLEVVHIETVEGFNLNKGQSQTLRLATIRRRPNSGIAVRDMGVKQTRVK